MVTLPRRRATDARRSRGFTLVEVLIALAVLAIALGAVLRSVGQAVDTATALRRRTVALWVAENRLAIHQIRGDWISVSVHNGTSSEGGREWRWRETVAKTPVTDVRRIDIDVRRKGGSVTLAHVVGFLRKVPPS